jgi:hypothetical protein
MNSQTTPLLNNDAELVVPNDETRNINSCIICLEEDKPIDTRILEGNTMTFLIKNCSCQFYIHEKCFNLWFFKNPVCPICKLPLYYQETLYNPLTTYKNGEYVFIENDKHTSCLKNILRLLILLFVLCILINIFLPFENYKN